MQQRTTEREDVIHNGFNVTQLGATIGAIQENPPLAKFQFRAANDWDQRLHSQATIESFYGTGQEMRHSAPFVLDADEPQVLLGEDSAANPAEIALAALSACMTSSLIYKASAMGIELSGVQSEYEGDVDLHGFLGLDPTCRSGFNEIRVKFKVKGDIDAATVEELIKTSPIYDSLANPVRIKIEVETA
ncbi:OsmC family protein [soil metagenome]